MKRSNLFIWGIEIRYKRREERFPLPGSVSGVAEPMKVEEKKGRDETWPFYLQTLLLWFVSFSQRDERKEGEVLWTERIRTEPRIQTLVRGGSWITCDKDQRKITWNPHAGYVDNPAGSFFFFLTIFYWNWFGIYYKNMTNNKKLMVFPPRKIQKIKMIDDTLAIPN